MARLFKLVVDVEVDTTVTLQPNILRYFYELNPDDVDPDTGELTIPANSFVDDTDAPVTDITLVNPDNGYYLLFVNGVLQQDDLFTVDTTEVVVQDAADIPEGTTIVLVVNNFLPEAENTTTVGT
ncbi:MAG: DUF4183 domain-containing protein [Tissierellia bacterium]|nr:DUF4183 domain-containing protein [Tissierellia bacterium]